MPSRCAICIVVDGLRASALGCYGGAWSPTPNLDRLASLGAVVDWMWADSPCLASFYKSVWRGRLAWRPSGVGPSLPKLLRDAGADLRLVTDDVNLASSVPDIASFEATVLDPPAARAASSADAAISNLLAASVPLLPQGVGGAPSLLWIHARGLRGPWDAPLEFQAKLLEGEGLPTLDIVEPPNHIEESDPDQILRFRAAYAAQVAVLDLGLGGLIDCLRWTDSGAETLLAVASPRGFAMAEHGRIGTQCKSLYSELLHAPCLVSAPSCQGPLRTSRLVQPIDLHATLADWLLGAAEVEGISGDSLLVDDVVATQRSFAIAAGRDGEAAIRTPAWMLRRSPFVRDHEGRSQPQGVELYVKPDDRWEVNEILARRPEVGRQLGALLDAAVEPNADLGELQSRMNRELLETVS